MKLRRHTRFRTSILAALLLAGLGQCSSHGGRPDIVLITVDTLRADHVGLFGYGRNTTPNIDAFFGEGTVFERAYATSSFTPTSVVSILTGLIPQHHGVRYFLEPVAPDVTTVPKSLGDAGYQTAAIVSNAVLEAEWTKLDAHFDHYDDRVTERERTREFYQRTAGPTTDAAIKWLDEERDPGKPMFLWVHYYDPHGPYRPPDAAPRDFDHETPRTIDVERVPDYQRYPDITDGLEYVDRYDGEIAYMDREVGRLLARLAASPNADTTLYVFTSDHGESMMDHEQWFGHGYQVYEELIRVPLAVRGPGFERTRIASGAGIVDIAPSLFLAAHVRSGHRFDGAPLQRLNAGRTFIVDGVDRAEDLYWRSAIQGRRKWMLGIPTGNRDTPRQKRYYDLANDPGEQHPRPWPEGDLPHPVRLLATLVASDPDVYVFDSPSDFSQEFGGQTKNEVVDEAQERLRALGYIQ